MMSKEFRKKNVTEEDLFLIIEDLIEVEKLLLKEAKIFLRMEFINTTDLYHSAIINRAISFIRGFKLLASENNYISSVPIIRMQIDNCLRLYAGSIVADYSVFYYEYLKGTHIRNLKDMNGKRMTDSYLVKQLDEVFPGIQNLYKNTSGYIHLSNKHSFLHTEIVDGSEKKISARVGYFDFFKIDEKVDYAYNMFKASWFLLELVK